MKIRTVLVATLTVPLLAHWCGDSFAAPAPLPGRAARPLTPADLAGRWVMVWAGHRWDVELTPGGDYSCTGTGMAFVGSWSLARGGVLWVTESPRPSDPQSWRTYSVRLCPVTLSGRVDHGSHGTEVRLFKAR